MNRVFLDTSAAYALLVASDQNHGRAARTFGDLRLREAGIATTSYVLVETYALLMSRVGASAARAFREDLQPLADVTWVGPELHERALDLLFERDKTHLSLVDAVSFLAIQDQGIDEVFAYDRHFEQEGFSLLD